MDLLRSLPIGLYLEQPITWLHHIDARIKLLWLSSFLLAPVLASSLWRVLIVVLLVALTLSAHIPLRVWRQQMGWLLIVGTMVTVLTAIAPDGISVTHQPRLPAQEITFAQDQAQRDAVPEAPQSSWLPLFGRQSSQDPATTLPQPPGYRYVLLDWGPLTVTRRSLDLGIRFSTLLFTLVYSSTLFLLTTAPEEITAALEELMQPLRRFNWPITEIALTLTLSLRFIPLVMEEIQNLVRSVQTRAINWKKLGLRGASQVWLMLVERLLENLLLRAKQISSAMVVRGFTTPNQHQVQWHALRLHRWDWLAIVMLVVLWSLRLRWGWQV